MRPQQMEAVYRGLQTHGVGKPVGGAGVFVRSHIGATPIHRPGRPTTANPAAIIDGWAAACHIDFAMKGGMVCVAAYQEEGAGYGPETGNWKRCLQIGEFIREMGKPFLIGADWNTTPAVLNASLPNRSPGLKKNRKVILKFEGANKLFESLRAQISYLRFFCYLFAYSVGMRTMREIYVKSFILQAYTSILHIFLNYLHRK